MKTYKNLYEKLCSFENLLKAMDKAAKGKKKKPNVARFLFHYENELVRLRRELLDQSYCPGPYHHFVVYESKKRDISAADFRDRVVHHALCNIIESLFDRSFIEDSYACRSKKGTHQAVERLSQFIPKNRYVLKCDIRKYFPSIDHQYLYAMFAKKILDPHVLWLIQTIINSADEVEPGIPVYFPGDDLFTPINRRKGLPIGNQTSQFFANVYLNEFDHFIKEILRCWYYIRYVDDFVILHQDKQFLHEIRKEIEKYLMTLRLTLHPNKSQIFPIEQGTDFLGYRVFPGYRLIRKSNVKRFKRRLKRYQRAYADGELTLKGLTQRIRSWLGHACWANSHHLRKQIFDNITFVRHNNLSLKPVY